MVKILEKAGNDLSRKNIMDSATSVNFPVPMLLPGIFLETSETDYRINEKFRLMRLR